MALKAVTRYVYRVFYVRMYVGLPSKMHDDVKSMHTYFQNL